MEVRLTGDSVALERAFAGAGKAGTKARNQLEAAGAGVQAAGAKMTSAGKSLTRNVSLPLGLIGGAAIKTAVDFEKSMRNVNSIAGLPAKQFRKLGNEVTAMAGPLAQSPKTLSEGLYDLVSSGFDAKESMVVLHSSAKAATAGLTTTEVSTKAVSAALNAYHRPASEAGAISDDLFETVNRGVVSFEELAGSIGMVLPAASTLGITSKEVGAGISTLTKEGQSGDTAITNLNQALTAFVKPSKAMNDAVHELGYKNAETMLKTLHFQGSLEALYKVAGGSKEKLGAYFGNVRAMRAVFGLTGDSAKTARGDLKAFSNDTGSTAKVFKEQTHSVAFQFSQLKAEAEVLGISLGHKLFPLIRSIGKELGGAVKGFTELPAGVQKSIVQFGLFAFAAGPVIRLVGGLTSGIGGLLKVAGGIGEVGKGIGGFASMFGTALKSGQGIAGSFSIAGESAAPALMKGLKVGLPAAAAAAGIGNIVYSAAKGDWREAGIKAGGAVAGGIAGAFLGGPAGAAIGVGLGSALAGALDGLFKSSKKLSPVQTRLREESDHAAAAFRRQREAVKGLTAAEDGARASAHRTKASAEAVTQAQNEKRNAVKKFGPASKQAEEAELKLAHAQHKDAATAEEAKDAHRLAGLELRLFKHRTVEAYDSERQREGTLKGMVSHLQAQYNQEKGNYGLLERLVGKRRELSKAQQNANQLVEESASKVGPKWARSLERQDNVQQQFGKHLRGLVNQLPELGHVSHTASERAVTAWEHMGDVFHTRTNRAKTDVHSFDSSTVSSIGDTVSHLNSGLAALGVQQVDFGGTRKQRGGGLGGTGTGDTIPAMLEPGEYVLNKKAVEHVGTSALDAINFNVAPRFQKGGSTSPIGPEPRITGTQPLRGAGQNAIHQVFKAAVKYYNAHAEPKPILSALRWAEHEASLGLPYTYGGGHGALGVGSPGLDCSGYTSGALGKAGFIDAPMAVSVGSGLYTLGAAGPGKFLTWGVRGTSGENAHTMFSIKKPGNKGWGFFESGGSGGGPHEDSGWDGSFSLRHMPGYQRGGKIPVRAQEKIAKYGEDAFNPRSRNFVGWGFQKGGAISGKVSYFGGGTEASGMNTSQPGIAVNLKPGSESGWQNSTTEGWMTAAREGHPVYASVTIAGKSANLPITDLGPAGFTQRAIDVTEGGVRKLGFTTSNFPTDAVGKAVIGGTTASGKTKKPSKRSVIEGSKHFAKGRTSAGGTSAGFATSKEIGRARTAGAAHAKNPTLSHGIAQSPLPSWAKGLPLYQREELEGRATTLPERETILGNAETNATFEEGIAERALAKAKKAYAQNPNATTWAVVAAKSSRVREKRKAQAAATKARKLFEKGYIDHLTKGIKKINSQLESGAGKLSMKQVAALRAKRAELVSLRASARGEAQTAVESLEGYKEAGEAEAAEIEEESPLNKIVEGFNGIAESIGEQIGGEGSSSAEEAKQAQEEHTSALKEVAEALKAQTDFAAAASATTNASAWKALSDILSGNLGARTAYAASTAGNGTIGRM